MELVVEREGFDVNELLAFGNDCGHFSHRSRRGLVLEC
jgi:hypothetical protein